MSNDDHEEWSLEREVETCEAREAAAAGEYGIRLPPPGAKPGPVGAAPRALVNAARRLVATLQASQPCPLCDSTPHRPGAPCADLVAAIGTGATAYPSHADAYRAGVRDTEDEVERVIGWLSCFVPGGAA